jgi:hypothetical protein
VPSVEGGEGSSTWGGCGGGDGGDGDGGSGGGGGGGGSESIMLVLAVPSPSSLLPPERRTRTTITTLNVTERNCRNFGGNYGKEDTTCTSDLDELAKSSSSAPTSVFIGATNDGAAATKRRSASGTHHFSLSYSLNQFTSLLLFKWQRRKDCQIGSDAKSSLASQPTKGLRGSDVSKRNEEAHQTQEGKRRKDFDGRLARARAGPPSNHFHDSQSKHCSAM